MSVILRNWKVLRLKPRTEKALADLFDACGIPRYLPVRTATRTYASKRKTVELPLFPGYVFAAFDDDQRREFLPRQNYILRIITPIAPIRMLRQLVAVRQMLREKPDFNPKGELKAGQLVRVKSGPMRDMYGRITRIQSRTQVMLHLDFIGKDIPVTMPGALLEIVGGQ